MTYIYEPPRGNLPAGVTEGVVHGHLLRAIDDGSDAGNATDAVVASGRITFTPSTSYIDYNNDLIVLEVRTAIVDSNGDFSIQLVSTDNTAPIVNWTYRVDFHITDLPIPSFNIDVPAGSNRPLASIVPRTTQGSTVVIKGDTGSPGPMSIVGLHTYVDGDGDIAFDDSGPTLFWGSGSPNGVLTKPKGSLYVDSNAAADFLYVKTTTSGNTGWVVIK